MVSGQIPLKHRLHIQDKHYEIRISPLMEDTFVKGYLVWIFDMSFINQYTDEMINLFFKFQCWKNFFCHFIGIYQIMTRIND